MMEAIVRGTLRPSLYVSKDKILSSREGVSAVARQLMEKMDLEFSDQGLFEANRQLLETTALSAGRLNLVFGIREYAGTGWLLDDDIVVTNRHVARLFATRWMQDEWDFQDGQFDRKVQVFFNNVEQIDTDDDRSVKIREILWVAEPGEPDMALLRVQTPNLEPIRLSEQEIAAETPVAVVGYPERDPRDNPKHLIVSFWVLFVI
jgi:endonuclease G